MRKVVLNMKETQKFNIIKAVADGNKSKNRAEVELGLTRRQINRLLASYKMYGKEAFRHKSRGRASHRATPDNIKKHVVDLYQTDTYYDANFVHFTECLEKYKKIKLSVTTVSNILQEADILSPMAHKQTKRKQTRKLKKALEESSSEEKKQDIEEKIISLESAHPLRPRKKYRGELVQMDASQHDWFSNNTYAHLHAIIDDASGDIVGAYFDVEETLRAYHHATYQMLFKHGIPYKTMTDYRGVFNDNSKNNKPDEANSLTQYGYMCKQLGIELECTFVPQKKGRVERLFKTLQSRLPIEFKIRGIDNIDDANEFLESYLKEFNLKFGSKVDSTTSVFESPPSKERANTLLAVLKPRVVNKGHHIRFDKHYYMPIDKHGKSVFFESRTKALVIKAFDGKLYVSINEKTYALRQLQTHELLSPEFDNQPTEPGQQKIYIPDYNHPWKAGAFTKFVYEFQLSAKEWDDLRYTSENRLADVNKILGHYHF